MHTMRYHAHYKTGGTGHLDQGRFKSFPIQSDEHLLTVMRYVERNPVRANFTELAEAWEWGSADVRQQSAIERRWLSIPDDPPPSANVAISRIKGMLSRNGMPLTSFERWEAEFRAQAVGLLTVEMVESDGVAGGRDRLAVFEVVEDRMAEVAELSFGVGCRH